MSRKCRWAIHDRSKFATLIDDLRQFTHGLWAVTNSPATVKEQAQSIKEEVRSIRDPEILSLLVEGTAQTHVAWSDAASEALEFSSLGEEERQRVLQWMNGVDGDEEPFDSKVETKSTTAMEPRTDLRILRLRHQGM